MAKKTGNRKNSNSVVTELPELQPNEQLHAVEEAIPSIPVVVASKDPTIVYKVVAPKRPLTGMKFGVSGNEYTHNKLAEAATANGGTLTPSQARQVCVDANHKGFFTYALNRLHILIPVVVEPVFKDAATLVEMDLAKVEEKVIAVEQVQA